MWFQAVLRSVPIVSLDWISRSVKAKRLLPPKDFSLQYQAEEAIFSADKIKQEVGSVADFVLH